MSAGRCGVCPHNCIIEEGKTGFCRARSCRDGTIIDDNYGKITSIALDPIEKKPLRHFYPGSMILSVGSYGCNLRCPFCQNHEISMAGADNSDTVYMAPHELVSKAESYIDRGNIGLAFTYNEPLIGYEYTYDCAKSAHEHGLKTVLVTNGYINPAPLQALLPYIDALNIDLKGFTDAYYRKLEGHLEPVKRTITAAAARCHVEVTTLIVPGENDSPDEMRSLSAWLGEVDKNIPLHITRFFPRYHFADKAATPVSTVYMLADVARRQLVYVYEGNC